MQLRVVPGRIFDYVRFECDARSFDEDHAVGTVVLCSIAIVRVVNAPEVLSHADSVSSGLDVDEHFWLPNAFLALAVGAVMVEITELPEQGAFSDTWPADYSDAHSDLTVGKNTIKWSLSEIT